MTISDSINDVPIDNSNGRDDVMQKNRAIPSKVAFSSMISTLPFELSIGTSMVLSEIVIIVHDKVSEPSK